MFSYYLKLGLTSLRKNQVLTLLMVVTISMGIGLFMTIMTIYYYMDTDPIPNKSDHLYRILVDSGNPRSVDDSDRSIPNQLTYIDATNLINQQDQFPVVVMYGATAGILPDNPNITPFEVKVRATTHEFFNLFDTPFQFGSGWTRTEDDELAPVVVLSNRTNERLFGGVDSVGETLDISSVEFRIVGVLDEWVFRPKAYDLNTGPFDTTADVFLPFQQGVEMSLPRRGNTSCWKPIPTGAEQGFLQSECTWIQAWVEIANNEERDQFSNFLTGYIEEQKQLGRFERPNRNRLYSLEDWLEYRQAVPPVVVVLLASSFMFLVVCQFNTLSLLMAKLLSHSREIGIRRAMGATRTAVFSQIGIEALLIGVLGSLFGLVLAGIGIEAILYLLRDEADITEFFRIDFTLALIGIATAVASTLLVALYPMYRASQLQVASQLRANQ